jgi:hypothetical protein
VVNDWVKKHEVEKSGGNTYITSEAKDGTYGCSCPAWTLQRKECKHIKMVKGLISAPVGYAVKLVYDASDRMNTIEPPQPVKLDSPITWPNLPESAVKPEKSAPTVLEVLRQNAIYGGINDSFTHPQSL